MSEQAATQHHPAAQTVLRTSLGTPDHSGNRLRMLGLAAVCLGVAALAGVAFVLSYSGIRAVALGSGISARHAGDYPVMIDAMLVIALLAVLGLRGAGLPSRILSWLALLAVLAVGAAADVQYATGRVLLQYDQAATTAAVLPWALVFLAFVLLLALLRHGRVRHQASVARRRTSSATDALPAVADQTIVMPPPATSLPVRTPRTWDSASIVPGFSARLVSSAAAGAAAGVAATETGEPSRPAPGAATSAVTEDLAAEDTAAAAEPEDPPAEDTAAAAEPEDPPAEDTAAAEDPPAEPADADATAADTAGVEAHAAAAGTDEPGTGDQAAADEGADGDVPDNMPVFHRMWTTPTPPES